MQPQSMLKRTEEEELMFRAVLKVQAKKECVSLQDAISRLKRRNWEMAMYLRSKNIELPEYYNGISAIKAMADLDAAELEEKKKK